MSNIKPWYEEDEFWEDAEPVLFSKRRCAGTPKEIEDVISLLKIKPGIAVLDMCCGVGRHSIELARRGFCVTGVDRTQIYIEKASKKAMSENLNVEFIHSDIRTFCRPGSFDAVINMFTSFGYFEDPEEDKKAALNMFNSLKKGGVLIMDTMGKEIVARIFQEKGWQEEDGVFLLEDRKVIDFWSRTENRWIIISKDGRRVEHRFTHRLYSASEIVSLLKSCGFSHTEVYGDMLAGAYDQNARRLIVVAHK